MHILLVEDDEIDAEAVVRGFQRQGFAPPLTIARNGLEALQMLRSPAAHNSLKQPCLIITDLNMPLMNGIEFLQALRRDANLRRSVVFVLSSSNWAADKSAAYEQGVAGYLLKADLDKNFLYLVHLLECYQAMVEFPVA
jgi:CheY-like chemotaxis protein